MKYNIKIVDESNKEINLGEDEIININYKIGLVEKGDYANSRSSTELEIVGKMISNIEEKDESKNLYTINKENLINLIKWAESYMEKSDYRDVIINIDLGSEKYIDYKFNNMFVYEFLQEFSIEKGIGIFNIKLRQKFNQKNKLDVK